jgi:predicted secreted protein
VKSLAIFIVVWVVALYAMVSVSEHRRQNAGLPVVKSSVAQGDIARANTLLSPCPLTPQNLPRIILEEKA